MLMNKKKNTQYLTRTFLAVVVSAFILDMNAFGFCSGCFRNVPDLFQYIAVFLIALIPIFLTLRFTKESVFLTWKRFAIPYLVLSAVVLLVDEIDRGGDLFDGEIISFFLAVFFLIISIILIVYKTHKLKKTENLN
jgi:uncharacterized membrane protein YidH (DUF202 family)